MYLKFDLFSDLLLHPKICDLQDTKEIDEIIYFLYS